MSASLFFLFVFATSFLESFKSLLFSVHFLNSFSFFGLGYLLLSLAVRFFSFWFLAMLQKGCAGRIVVKAYEGPSVSGELAPAYKVKSGSGEVWNSHDRLLRQHRKETFINKWHLVTVLIPSYATEQLVTVERWRLKFTDRLRHAGVKMLLDFLKGNDHQRNKKIQGLAVNPFICNLV
ncbi:hypothetical protein OROMI_018639 [Orobanche minor]